MTTRQTLAKTLKLFQPEQTAVIFCPDPKLPQTFYYDLMDKFSLTHQGWGCGHIVAQHENSIIAEMQDCLAMEPKTMDLPNKNDKTKPQWFLVSLAEISHHYENNLEKLCRLLVEIDNFAKTNHLKMIVAFPTTDATLPGKVYAGLPTTQKPHFTMMSMTNKTLVTLNSPHS